MKKKLLRQTAIPVLTAACVFSQVGMTFAALPSSSTVNTNQAYTQGTWKQEAQGWKHYDANQKPSTGWIYKESGWYYIDPATGYMKTGWIQDANGRWFYLETAADQGGVEGRLHTGWLKDQNGNWYFMNTVPGADFGAMLTGWQWIDNSCYYFGTDAASDIGRLYMSTTTPDGYKVNNDGRWVNADGSIRHDQKGIASAVNADGTPVVKENTSDSSDSGSSSSSSGGNHSSGNGGSSNGGSSNGGNSGNNGSDNNGNNGSDNNGSNSGDNGSDNNGGNSGDNGSDNNGGNSGDNGSDNNGGNSDDNDDTSVSVIDENKTKIMNVDSLGKWLTITFDEGYNADNCIITVDGKDVTSSLTKVTDDGSIAKLPLVGTPGTVTAVSKEDSKKSESVVLNEKADENSVYTEDGYLPEKILGHGAIPVWDYYLTNYDDEGNVRVTPSKTTITMGAVKEAHPSYSPDAEIDENGNGTVTIMFNYNTAEEKAWFDAISGLELVQYNENRNTINDHLEYTATPDVAHGQGKVGTLTIALGQDNFRNNGRYYVRVRSTAGSSAMASIHVVNKEAPTLMISESAVSGRNLHFTVKDMVYGITVPIERVTLTDPTGDTKELNKIDDWYLIGDLFVLYNDVNAENGRNNIPYNGKYTITLYSNGFKTINKSFTVTGGEDVPTAKKVSTLSVDAVSRATSSGSSSGSGDGGSTSTSADLIFDSDLLVNANILNDMNEQNDAVTGIIDYWYMLSGVDSVFDTGDTTYYTWLDYFNAVSDAALDGTTLTFAEYKENGEEDPNRPYAVKEVLEDGLLGDIQHSDSYGRFEAPAVTVASASEGSDLVLSCEDTDYLGKVTALYLNGDWRELDSSKYTVDAEAGTITINAAALKPGEVTVTIDASGYKSQTVKVDYNKVVEEDLSLKVNYADGKDAFTPDETGKATVSFTVEGSDGDFLSNLKEPVVLINADGEADQVYHYFYESRDSVYFEVSEDKKTLTLHNVIPGTYTLEVSANYYEDSLSAKFTVSSNDSGSTDVPSTTKTAPTIANIVKTTGFSSCYRLSFFGSTDDITAFLDAVKKVTVNDTVYTSGETYSDSHFKKSRKSDSYGTEPYTCLDLSKNGFDSSTTATITVEADGYTTLTYEVELDSNGQVTNNTTRTAPELIYDDEISKGCDLEITCDDSDYLNAVESIYNGSTYNNIEFTVKTIDKKIILTVNTGAKLSVSDSVTLTLTANGYDDQNITFSVITGSAPIAETATFVEKDVWDTAHYRISFSDDASVVNSYLNAITSVTVGNTEYSKSSFFFNDNQYRSGKEGSYYVYLDLASNGFSADGNTTIKIVSDGYEDYTFAVDSEGNIVDVDDNTPSNPGNETSELNIADVELITENGILGTTHYYLITFEGLTGKDLDNYISAINNYNGVSINNKSVLFNRNYNDNWQYESIKISADKFTADELNVISITAENYPTLTYEFTPASIQETELVEETTPIVSDEVISDISSDSLDEVIVDNEDETEIPISVDSKIDNSEVEEETEILTPEDDIITENALSDEISLEF